MDKIKKRIGELNKELLNLRRDFHKHPELGFEEHRTAEIVENYLKNIGLYPQRMTKTGVVALLEGSKPQPVLMLRADMDALPVEEENDVDYKSKNKGIMHACGHDAHMAMLLVAAKIFDGKQRRYRGNHQVCLSTQRGKCWGPGDDRRRYYGRPPCGCLHGSAYLDPITEWAAGNRSRAGNGRNGTFQVSY